MVKKMIKYPLNVTIDTNIFEANKFDFGAESTLSLLVKNVKNGKIKLVLSKIVICEVEKHICLYVDDLFSKARKLRKEYLEILPVQYLASIGMDKYIQLPDKENARKNAKDVFNKFLKDCNVEILDTVNVNAEEILDDYFAVRPPFENSDKKKNEFPDAFIAKEIQERFGSDNIVAIISQDNGFKNACKNNANHMLFSSLGEFFDALNKNDSEYKTACEQIRNKNVSILQKIQKMIDENCIEVHGLTTDQDGIIDGHEYDEIYLKNCFLSSMRIHTIEDIDGDIITASLWIRGMIDVNCYFEDFENASWDSEEKDYIYVETKHILEKHNVVFACRIGLNMKTGNIKVFPFKIILGGDSIVSRTEINDEYDSGYKELADSDRKEQGFLPLNEYCNMLGDGLNVSDMGKSIIDIFKQYNSISSCYETLAVFYEDTFTQLKSIRENNANAFISALSSKKIIPIELSTKDNDKALDEIDVWFNKKINMISEKSERNLPDYIEYGESIIISGAKSNVYTLFIDELHGIPEAGSEEQIEISLLLEKKIIARGYIKLTVGYISFDEEGRVSDGIEDGVDYQVDDVLKALKIVISNLKEELVNEQELANTVKMCWEQSEAGIE